MFQWSSYFNLFEKFSTTKKKENHYSHVQFVFAYVKIFRIAFSINQNSEHFTQKYYVRKFTSLVLSFELELNKILHSNNASNFNFFDKIYDVNFRNFNDIFKSIANDQTTTTLWIISSEQRKRTKKLIWKAKNRRKKKCANRRFAIKNFFYWSSQIKSNERKFLYKIRWRFDHLYVKIQTSIFVCKMIEKWAFDLYTLIRTYRILKIFKVLSYRKRDSKNFDTCKYELHVRIMIFKKKTIRHYLQWYHAWHHA